MWTLLEMQTELSQTDSVSLNSPSAVLTVLSVGERAVDDEDIISDSSVQCGGFIAELHYFDTRKSLFGIVPFAQYIECISH